MRNVCNNKGQRIDDAFIEPVQPHVLDQFPKQCLDVDATGRRRLIFVQVDARHALQQNRY